MKLIDADKLIEKLSANLDNPAEFPVISLGTVMRMIDSEYEVHALQPEIIRCKDCKHRPDKAWFGCPMASSSKWNLDGFCFLAERRTDGSD